MSSVNDSANDSRIRILRIAWVALVLVGFFPGGLYFSNIEVTVLGWPFFVLWSVIIVPFSFVILYGIYAYTVMEMESQVSSAQPDYPMEDQTG